MTRSASRALGIGVLVGIASVVIGCTTLAPKPVPGDPVAWAARRVALATLDSWQLDGRVAIAAAEDGGSGSLLWVQTGSSFDFRFKGPLGVGGQHIRGDAAQITVTTSKGETFTVADPERELDARIGWSVPFASMRFWMVGVPDPAEAFDADFDAAGRPREIRQLGWTVRYDAFHAEALPAALPRRFSVERDAVRIKVVAERWTL